jgi:hypothetical protein
MISSALQKSRGGVFRHAIEGHKHAVRGHAQIVIPIQNVGRERQDRLGSRGSALP